MTRVTAARDKRRAQQRLGRKARASRDGIRRRKTMKTKHRISGSCCRRNRRRRRLKGWSRRLAPSLQPASRLPRESRGEPVSVRITGDTRRRKQSRGQSGRRERLVHEIRRSSVALIPRFLVQRRGSAMASPALLRTREAGRHWPATAKKLQKQRAQHDNALSCLLTMLTTQSLELQRSCCR